MTQLTLNQKNSILSVAHEHLCHPSSIDHAVNAISSIVHLESDLVKSYLSSLYDLDALVAARAGQKADDVPESPSKRIKPSSPLKNSTRPIEPVELPSVIEVEQVKPDDETDADDEIDGDEEADEEEQDQFGEELMEDQPEDEAEDGLEEEPEDEPEEPKRSSRSRRSSSAVVLPEVLVTPVKRPRRR